MNMEEQAITFELSSKEIEENHKQYLERIDFYNTLGIDHSKIRSNIIQAIDIKPERILEIGTGKGYLTSLLAGLVGDRVLSVDVNKEEQKIAALNVAYAKVLDKVSFYCLNAEKLPFGDRSFDLVISALSFHHFEQPFAILREMIRLTQSRLIITDFNRKGFELISEAHRRQGGHHEHKSGDFSIVGAYLKEHTFEVIEKEDTWQKMYIAKK